MSHFLRVYVSVTLDAYTISGVSCMPVLIVCWLFGVKPKRERVAYVIGVGAAAVVALSYMVALA